MIEAFIIHTARRRATHLFERIEKKERENFACVGTYNYEDYYY